MNIKDIIPTNVGSKGHKELKRLNRAELLELLLEQTKRAEALRKELELKEQELAEKELIIKEAGSIAEASLRLNKVFEAAQEAADQYLYNIKLMAEGHKDSHSVGSDECESITDSTRGI